MLVTDHAVTDAIDLKEFPRSIVGKGLHDHAVEVIDVEPEQDVGKQGDVLRLSRLILRPLIEDWPLNASAFTECELICALACTPFTTNDIVVIIDVRITI